MNLMTTIGEGRAIVSCAFELDYDGDVEGLEVVFQGVNIVDALTEDQVLSLEDECKAHAKAESEAEKADVIVERHLAEMECEVET